MINEIDVKKIREKAGLTQEGFAFQIGVSVRTVARWEAGISKPSKLARKIIYKYLLK